MDLKELRTQIDRIDDSIVELFCRRMEVSSQIAAYKKANNLPILVPAREQEKLADVAQKAGAEMAEYAKALYETLFTLSRNYQAAQNGTDSQQED